MVLKSYKLNSTIYIPRDVFMKSDIQLESKCKLFYNKEENYCILTMKPKYERLKLLNKNIFINKYRKVHIPDTIIDKVFKSVPYIFMINNSNDIMLASVSLEPKLSLLYKLKEIKDTV